MTAIAAIKITLFAFRVLRLIDVTMDSWRDPGQFKQTGGNNASKISLWSSELDATQNNDGPRMRTQKLAKSAVTLKNMQKHAETEKVFTEESTSSCNNYYWPGPGYLMNHWDTKSLTLH